MNQALIPTNGTTAATVTGYSREAIETIKNTVAKGATDAELDMFLHLAARYGLDPFAKEIWCTKYVKQGQDPKTVPATIIVSRDGYLKAAQQDPDFDGIASGVVKEGDLFAFNPVNGTVSHEFGAKRGGILGAWAVVHHKRRRPVACFAEFSEYKGGSPIWQNYPSAMIQKVAEVHALKRQFGLSGIVSKEELDYQDDEAPALITAPQRQQLTAGNPLDAFGGQDNQPPAKSEATLAREAFMAEITGHAKAAGINANQLKAARQDFLRSFYGLDSVKEMTPEMLREARAAIAEYPEKLTQFFPGELPDAEAPFIDGEAEEVKAE